MLISKRKHLRLLSGLLSWALSWAPSLVRCFLGANLDNDPAHQESAQTRNSYATIAQLGQVNDKLDALGRDVTGMKHTVEGKIEGAKRIPGLVDIVGSYSDKMDAITRVLYGIGILLAGELALNILRQFGMIK